ncbi:Hypothetical protein NTJ_06154 [Nesidiocoris tenuis]|uniref:Uncharacterized protein n=1 Tax=Nesidiocoris tenuis TaxID=355587 RepID=A0ABN7AR04_9HEMI|nr:Hypothetical protein NTJ_06154 [Nesidiocoris tenuis]
MTSYRATGERISPKNNIYTVIFTEASLSSRNLSGHNNTDFNAGDVTFTPGDAEPKYAAYQNRLPGSINGSGRHIG